MFFCGIGKTAALNTLIGASNLPSVSPTTLKEREREAGIAFEAVADETYCQAQLEKKGKQVYIIYYVLYSYVRKSNNLSFF